MSSHFSASGQVVAIGHGLQLAYSWQNEAKFGFITALLRPESAELRYIFELSPTGTLQESLMVPSHDLKVGAHAAGLTVMLFGRR